MGFPVLTIERVDCRTERLPAIDTAPRHGKSVWVGARDIEALNAACFAEQVFRCARVEGVFGDVVCALTQTKTRGGNDDVDVSAHRADRAIAVFNVKCVWKINFEPNSAAMTAALMCCARGHIGGASWGAYVSRSGEGQARLADSVFIVDRQDGSDFFQRAFGATLCDLAANGELGVCRVIFFEPIAEAGLVFRISDREDAWRAIKVGAPGFDGEACAIAILVLAECLEQGIAIQLREEGFGVLTGRVKQFVGDNDAQTGMGFIDAEP